MVCTFAQPQLIHCCHSSPEPLPVCWGELQRDAVHTVPRIRGSLEPLTLENMTQVTSARCTRNLHSTAIGIALQKKEIKNK